MRSQQTKPAHLHFLLKLFITLVALPLLYRMLWPLAFAIVYGSWDPVLYREYKQFIWGQGLEMATMMKFLASLLAVGVATGGLLVWTLVDWSRIRASQVRPEV